MSFPFSDAVRRLCGLAVLLSTAGCASAPAPGLDAGPESVPASSSLLDAVLWVRTAPEYRAVALQTYEAAETRLEAALADSSWTAAVEQERPYRELPPAVILDVDETVLDNSPYEAGLVRRGETYRPETWGRWVRAAEAEPVPGSLAFTKEAARRGVTVFYVTNRDHEHEGPTRRNLEELGYPMSDERDVLLTEGERPEWTGDKATRRAAVARDFRVLLLLGDNLNDFVSARGLTPAERLALGARYEDRWGTRWFVLPNPMYGGWESAPTAGADELTPAEERRRKLESLTPPVGAGGTGGGSPKSP